VWKRLTQDDRLMLSALQEALTRSNLAVEYATFREQNFKFAVETQSDSSIPFKQRKSNQLVRNREAMLQLKRAVEIFQSNFMSVTDAQRMSLEKMELDELLELRYWHNLFLADPENETDTQALMDTQAKLDYIQSESKKKPIDWKKKLKIDSLGK